MAETPHSEAQASLDAANANGSAAQAEAAGGDGEGGDDEDDRRTIREVGTAEMGEEGDVVEGKVVAESNGETPREPAAKANANVKGGATNGREKVVDEPVAQSAPMVLSS